ncbi:MAG TPA: thioredoxin domain-containing protein [Flavisolibacter sp.]|jgi:protein-disulfide isomerase|nr:thioredoxin domain-containing protein [Flavisolibacter sp.]
MKKSDAPIIAPGDVFIGPANAPVTVLEFADYETEAAVAAHQAIKQILMQYEGKVRFSFRHFPLRRIHQKAQKAAEAAVAAAQEGLFWEMHEMLLQNRRNLGTISLKSYAKAIGVKNKRFLDELINGTYAWSVQDDLDEGLRMGVKRVPTFFINGQMMEGEVTAEKLREGIETALAENKR